ncbi:hypothetical protein [Methanoregula sp.]|uniref:hypothetical protein n=1 Tax=Methanoregula sp. TaxID=2052170 RepID=UPI00236C7917|nr:hypothetical protein [Methanoregula sp.]MDD1687042.1 hypothetical protein [Methanoregula sp.]
MQSRLTITVIVILCAALCFAGCSGTQSTPGTSASTGSSGSTASGSTLVTSPTDAIPSQNVVTVDVGEKDYLGAVPVIFQGGTGQIHVKKIEATIYRADGQTKTVTIGTNKGDEADLEGTKQTDRVVVYITFDNGQTLKTNDVESPYRTRQ